jgi:nucleoside-diphosphate-sugar epimerase
MDELFTIGSAAQKVFLPKNDLEMATALRPEHFKILSGKTLLVTGGTGFVGRWLIDSFLFMNEVYNFGSQLFVLTRDPRRFLEKNPIYNNVASLHFIEGDICTFEIKQPIDFCIHGANYYKHPGTTSDHIQTFETSFNGTRHLIDVCREVGCKRILYLSSGAASTSTDSSFSSYVEGKRIMEWLALNYARNMENIIVRCYSFIGPHLGLDSHYAVMNFISSAINKEKIVIKGDGSTIRSYLYAAEMCHWLWTALVSGKANEIYDVGSDESISMEGLAKKILSLSPTRLEMEILGHNSSGLAPSRYLPDVSKTKKELGLEQRISLSDAISRTINFYSGRPK